MESNSTAFLIKIKLRHSLGRPSRSDFVQGEVVYGEMRQAVKLEKGETVMLDAVLQLLES